MQTITFTTATPYDHVPRALDIMRKMGFGLRHLTVEEREQAFAVTLAFAAPQPPSINVLRHRLSQLGGIGFGEIMELPEGDASPAPAAQSEAA